MGRGDIELRGAVILETGWNGVTVFWVCFSYPVSDGKMSKITISM